VGSGKTTPIIGAEILRGSTSPLLQTGEIIAMSHHERWMVPDIHMD